jgi:hypothetical protein
MGELKIGDLTNNAKDFVNTMGSTDKTLKKTFQSKSKAEFIFNLTDKSHLDQNAQISYDYYDTIINSTDIMLKNDSGSYLNSFTGASQNTSDNLYINYYNPTNKPNLFFPDSTTSYSSKYISIYSLIHNNILNVTCDANGNRINSNIIGEMVIEHDSITGYGKVYTCFLLQKSGNSTAKNDIDNIVFNNTASENDKKETIKLKLNGLIQTSTCISYSTGYNIIIVFTKPITINNNSATSIQKYPSMSSLFANKPKDNTSYNIISKTSNLGGNNVGKKDDDEIYIDCKPTGASNEDIATYNVPINSEYTQDAQKLDFMKTTINLCMVIIFLLLTYFLVPFGYKMVVIDNVNKFIEEDKDNYKSEVEKVGVPVDRFVRIRSADTLLTIISSMIFVSLLYTGIKKNDFDMILLSLYFALIYGLSFSMIQFSKTSIDFMRTKLMSAVSGKFNIQGTIYPDEKVDKEPLNYFQPGDFGIFIMKSMKYAIIGNKGYNLLTMIFLALLTFIILLICMAFGYIKSITSVGNYLMYISLLIIFPIVPIFNLTNEPY